MLFANCWHLFYVATLPSPHLQPLFCPTAEHRASRRAERSLSVLEAPCWSDCRVKEVIPSLPLPTTILLAVMTCSIDFKLLLCFNQNATCIYRMYLSIFVCFIKHKTIFSYRAVLLKKISCNTSLFPRFLYWFALWNQFYLNTYWRQNVRKCHVEFRGSEKFVIFNFNNIFKLFVV